MGDTNEDGGGTTGGPIGDQVELGVVEGNPDYGKVVDGAGCDRIRPRSVWNERVNVPCRDEGLGGASELDRETSRAVGSAGAMAKATRRMGSIGRRNSERRTLRLKPSRNDTATS